MEGLFLKEPDRCIRTVESDEFDALLKATDLLEVRVLLSLCYRQGLRRAEAWNLRWFGPHNEPVVDFENGLVHVLNRREHGELTKSRKNRAVPLHPLTRQILMDLWHVMPKIVTEGRERPKYPHVFTLQEGTRFSLDWVSREFAKMVRRAGIARCSLHDLRRSFSTLAQRAGVDRHVVKDLGGWSAVSVLEKHYTGDVQGVLRAAMDQIAAAG